MNQLTCWKIGLLQVLILAYPVLATNGVKLQRPIALIGEDEKNLQLLWNQLCMFPEEQRLIPLSMMPKEFEKKWLESEYGVFYCSYNRGRYTNQNMERITVQCQMVDDEMEHQKLVLLFFNCYIPKEVDVEGTMFFSHLDGMASPFKCDIEKFIHFFMRNEAGLLQKVREGVNEIQEAHPILTSAKILLENYVMSEISTKEIPEFLQKTSLLNEKVQEEWEDTEKPEMYAIALNRAISENTDLLPPVLPRERVEAQDMEWIDEAIFFDHEAYYLPEPFFRFICERCISSASTTYIKSKLAEAGVLVFEGKARNYFTVKIEVVTVYGGIIKVRRMKLLRKKLDQYGEFTLQELSLMREEETYESEDWEVCETWEA